MKRYAKAPNTIIPPDQAASETPYSADLGDFDVQKLLDKGGVALSREIQNILSASAKGKLDAAYSRDLIAYLRLLQELKIEQKKELSDMDDESLAKLTKE